MKVTREAATAEFERWLNFKKIKPYKRDKNRKQEEELIELICDGSITINEKCEITYKLINEIKDTEGQTVLDSLTFKPRISVSDLNVKLKIIDADDADGRIMAYTSALTGENMGILGKLDSIDFGICSNIIVYFL